MSAALSWGEFDHRVAVREAVASFVRAHGRKRGLAMAAAAIGRGERAARHAHEGGDFAADAERAARADAARLALLTDQIRRLHAEAAEVAHRGLHVAMAGQAMDARGGVLRRDGGALLQAGEVTP